MRSTSKREQRINRVSSIVLIALSLIALFCVVGGFFQSPQPDEGAPTHVFQLSIVTLVPTVLLFVITADWKQHFRNAQLLAAAAATVAIAFGALYYLEHYR